MRKTNIVMKFMLTGLVACLITPLVSQQTSSGWVTTIAGTDYQTVADIKTDAQGNIYTIGSFSGTTDFDGSALTNNKNDSGETDVFVTKHSPEGQLIWVATFGGSKEDIGKGLDINASGEVYAVGSFKGSADFNTGLPSGNLSSAGQEDMFIVKLNSSGVSQWAIRFGSTSIDEASDVAIDHDGNLYVVGRFVSTVDFDPGSATFNLQAGGAPDAFILKLNSAGGFLSAFNIHSSGNDGADGVVVDGDNNVILTGYFDALADFDPGPNQHNVSANQSGSGDPFYLKLTPAMSFVWVTTIASTGYAFPLDVDVDKDNNIVTHGFFVDDINPEPGNSSSVIQAVYAEDSFTAKINHNGEMAWLHTIGGESLEFGYGVAVDALGDVYVTGFFNDSLDFDPGAEELFLHSAGVEETYIVKYNSQGGLAWAKRVGGTGGDSGYGIDINAGGDILVAGSFWGKSDFDPEPDAILNIQSKGSGDVAILHIDQMITSIAHESVQTVDWKLNPNPSTGAFTISGVEQFPVTISVMDMTGRILFAPYELYSQSQLLDLHDLPTGMYYFNIQSGVASAILKWIKI